MSRFRKFVIISRHMVDLVSAVTDGLLVNVPEKHKNHIEMLTRHLAEQYAKKCLEELEED